MTPRIHEWLPGPDPGPTLDGLARLLRAVVHDGASVGFVLPFSLDEARAYWSDRVLPGVRNGTRHLLIAGRAGEVAGTVHVILDTFPNQGHRAEIAKLLVHPGARRMGLGRALTEAAEEVARAERRTLITLDTRTGDAAEALCRSMGYTAAGVIPGYVRHPRSLSLESTTIFYKRI
jgi:ribosomal protein S18 acetylase RimI-like enzyme